MSADSVDQVFEKAISTIHTLSSLKGYNSLPRPPANIRTELYALFKQSTEGDVDGVLPRPTSDLSSPEYTVALKKWDAWKTKAGMSKTDAKKQYIQMLISTMKSYAMGTLAARELLADLEFLWSQLAYRRDSDADENSGMILALQDELQDTKSLRLRREIYETLFALNENKSGFSLYQQAGHNKKPKEAPEPRISRLRKIVRYLTYFLVRQIWNLAKKLVYHGAIIIAIVLTAKRLGFASPLKLDFTSPAKKHSEPSKSLCARSMALVCDGFSLIFKYMNRHLNIGLNQIYISVT
ncbi:LANO_0D03422g1_1 [Lachancea nothofagi CBS 11611]|uniref:LANO_0D03422g1_1 n=1 Tax=Lachancea nothofagi CBS 11611 TaxID=1266666 RepID=A0A1G4JFZ5_9SACH|nr:LANO_0D03422g1_1 [Lachancea nothofagi CBS 11611]